MSICHYERANLNIFEPWSQYYLILRLRGLREKIFPPPTLYQGRGGEEGLGTRLPTSTILRPRPNSTHVSLFIGKLQPLLQWIINIPRSEVSLHEGLARVSYEFPGLVKSSGVGTGNDSRSVHHHLIQQHNNPTSLNWMQSSFGLCEHQPVGWLEIYGLCFQSVSMDSQSIRPQLVDW